MGKIKNISFPPIISCRPRALCANKCYAKQAYLQYPGTKKAWDENYQLYKTVPTEYWNQLYKWFQNRHKPIKYFRWHVSGDIPDNKYYSHMILFCRIFNDIQFLCFTKRYELIKYKHLVPRNLTMIYSHWINDGITLKGVRQAWVYDSKDVDNRIPKSAYKCPADCQVCGLMCWKLKNSGHVMFNIH